MRETWLSDERGSIDGKSECIYFKADLPDPSVWDGFWKPSIFMPKRVCRIKLQITNIRIERLNNISEGDCISEGIDKLNQSLMQLVVDGVQYFDYSKRN